MELETYVNIHVFPSLSLEIHFISRQHYLTEEVLVHAGINYLICLYLCFPGTTLYEHNLRHTGNRSIEVIHGMLCGGTCSLPITSKNFCLNFLSKMNKAQQIHRVKHFLQRVAGNSIVSAENKRKSCYIANKETSASSSDEGYHLHPTYDKFLELKDTCKNGDNDSKNMIKSLVP